jgi:hypothetical protein
VEARRRLFTAGCRRAIIVIPGHDSSDMSSALSIVTATTPSSRATRVAV